MNTIGELVSQKRKENRLTQKELADLLHLTPSAISKWENDIAVPHISQFPQIAEALQIPVADLYALTIDDFRYVATTEDFPLLDFLCFKEIIMRDALDYAIQELCHIARQKLINLENGIMNSYYPVKFPQYIIKRTAEKWTIIACDPPEGLPSNFSLYEEIHLEYTNKLRTAVESISEKMNIRLREKTKRLKFIYMLKKKRISIRDRTPITRL